MTVAGGLVLRLPNMFRENRQGAFSKKCIIKSKEGRLWL